MTTKEREAQVWGFLEQMDLVCEAEEALRTGHAESAYLKLGDLYTSVAKSAPGVPVSLASQILTVSEPTVRDWTDQGVLEEVAKNPRRVSLRSIARLRPIVIELRELGQQRGLLESVLARFEDEETLGSEEFVQSLDELRRGETIVLRSREAA